MATQDTDDSVHQALIDHIACEMGEGGPTVIDETEGKITFRTLAHKERCIKQLSDRVDYEPVEADPVDQSTVDTNRELVDVTFQPTTPVSEAQYDPTQHRGDIEATGISDTEAAIEALQANPHVVDASEKQDFDTTVEVSVQVEATNLAVATGKMVGIVRGQLKHHDVEYGTDIHGDAVRVIISKETESTDAEQPTNEGEA